jgi:hypothetical protein
VLACSLVLALPHGWCCLFAAQLRTLTTPVAKEAQGCAGCCKHGAHPKPAGEPSKRPATPCPCDGRQTILPGSPAVEDGGLGLVCLATLLPPAASLPCVGTVEEAVWIVRPPAEPVHVCKCVWLC